METHTKPVGPDTMSLLILLPFFGETMAGGCAIWTKLALDGGRSSYRGPATNAGCWFPHRRHEGEDVGIIERRS